MMAGAFETAATIKTHGGHLLKLIHESKELGCTTKLNLFLPPPALQSGAKVPALYYLAGLTCTGDNGAEKGGFIGPASEAGLAIVFPDTSPRGIGAPGEDDAYDFGTGAGFYVDATTPGFAQNYRMYSYITKELPSLITAAFPIDGERCSIFGHSMGGHGALTLFLRNPTLYRSVSAFAPISNPLNCPWGQKAFSGYFGTEASTKGAEHDASELLRKWSGDKAVDILVDVGTGDNFYKQGQLLPEALTHAAEEAGVTGLRVRYQDGYDHSYYFMNTFARDHIAHHAKYLTKE